MNDNSLLYVAARRRADLIAKELQKKMTPGELVAVLTSHCNQLAIEASRIGAGQGRTLLPNTLPGNPFQPRTTETASVPQGIIDGMRKAFGSTQNNK